TREFKDGDWFDSDYVRHHAVQRSRRFPKQTANARNLRAFFSARGLCDGALWSQARLRGICLCTKIPESRDPETGSTETRFDEALAGSEAKDSPLPRPFGREIGKTRHAHTVRKSAIDRGLDEIGGEEGERECPVHVSDAALTTALPRR